MACRSVESDTKINTGVSPSGDVLIKVDVSPLIIRDRGFQHYFDLFQSNTRNILVKTVLPTTVLPTTGSALLLKNAFNHQPCDFSDIMNRNSTQYSMKVQLSNMRAANCVRLQQTVGKASYTCNHRFCETVVGFVII